MKLFILSGISFIFIASSALALSKSTVKPNIEYVAAPIQQTLGEQHFPAVPVLTGNEEKPEFSAQAVYAIDTDSYTDLYEKNTDIRFYPASTTKIITSLVALDYYPLDSLITVNQVTVPGQKMNLVKGEQLTALNMLYGLLVYSANDAAEVIGDNYPGGKEAFVAAMNAKAQSLNMTNSTFTNPSGLDDSNQLTTARDLARAAMAGINNTTFKMIVGTKNKTVSSIDGQIVHKLKNINQLLGTVEGVEGVKTGWTENAKENLVTYINRNDKKIMIVLLGSSDRFGETKKLIDWLYNNYTWEEVNPNNSTAEKMDIGE
jgi:D-alanyl-D-alanine carboxypeptidase